MPGSMAHLPPTRPQVSGIRCSIHRYAERSPNHGPHETILRQRSRHWIQRKVGTSRGCAAKRIGPRARPDGTCGTAGQSLAQRSRRLLDNVASFVAAPDRWSGIGVQQRTGPADRNRLGHDRKIRTVSIGRLDRDGICPGCFAGDRTDLVRPETLSIGCPCPRSLSAGTLSEPHVVQKSHAAKGRGDGSPFVNCDGFRSLQLT